jgi:hypothetical protein
MNPSASAEKTRICGFFEERFGMNVVYTEMISLVTCFERVFIKEAMLLKLHFIAVKSLRKRVQTSTHFESGESESLIITLATCVKNG